MVAEPGSDPGICKTSSPRGGRPHTTPFFALSLDTHPWEERGRRAQGPPDMSVRERACKPHPPGRTKPHPPGRTGPTLASSRQQDVFSIVEGRDILQLRGQAARRSAASRAAAATPRSDARRRVSLLPVAVDSCLALAASFVLASRCRQTAADQPPTLTRQTGSPPTRTLTGTSPPPRQRRPTGTLSLPRRTARTLTGTSSPPRQEGRRGHHPFRGGQQRR
jgi:hypothetical protein